MNIDNLRMFIQIVSLGSISKAADQMHISQSALSQQLKALESLLNCQLLERSNKGVRPTSAERLSINTPWKLPLLMIKCSKI